MPFEKLILVYLDITLTSSFHLPFETGVAERTSSGVHLRPRTVVLVPEIRAFVDESGGSSAANGFFDLDDV